MKKIEFSACAPPACKCPILKYNLEENPFVIVFDDYGKCITITPDEMDIIAKRWLEERAIDC